MQMLSRADDKLQICRRPCFLKIFSEYLSLHIFLMLTLLWCETRFDAIFDRVEIVNVRRKKTVKLRNKFYFYNHLSTTIKVAQSNVTIGVALERRSGAALQLSGAGGTLGSFSLIQIKYGQIYM